MPNTQELSPLESTLNAANDVFLVGGTSFLERLSNRNVWAIQAMGIVDLLAKQRHGRWSFRCPGSVIEEYNHAFENREVDDFGIPLAQKSLDELIPEFRVRATVISRRNSLLAAAAWMDSPEGKKRSKIDGWRETQPGYADQDVRTFAIDLASRGVDVCVASYDLKDELIPLEKETRLTLLGPSPLQAKYFAGLNVKAVLTGDVIGKLQAAESKAGHQDCVLFERNVRSGDMEFDAGVGVVRKKYFQPFEIPQEFGAISKNCYKVPIIKVGALNDGSTKMRVLKALREFNTSSLAVVDESSPFFPFLVASSLRSYSGTPLLRADLDFLHYQTTSVFGRETYVPVSLRKARASHR